MTHSTATFWSSPAGGEKTRILLIRHGHVDWNTRSVYAGWANVELDARGKREARALAERLKATDLAAVYSSDLDRAHRTAEIIADPHGIDVSTVEGLREINCGECEGLTVSEIEEKYGRDAFNAWKTNPESHRIPGGETFGEMRDRARAEIERIAEAHRGQTVAVVAHKCVNRVLICEWLGLSIEHYREIEQQNTAINGIVVDGNRVVVETVNDVCHIADIER